MLVHLRESYTTFNTGFCIEAKETLLLQEWIMAAFCVSMAKEMWARLVQNVVTSCSDFWCVLYLLVASTAECCYIVLKHCAPMQINPQDSFTRRGSDVYSTMPIGYTDAVLGTQLDVQTLRGTKSIEIPAGTQHGSIIKLYGHGVQTWGAASPTCGVHYLTLHVVLPQMCGQEELKLLERLRSLIAAVEF